MDTGRCTFGEKCTRAHSEAELEEWNHRYAVRKQQLLQSQEARAHGGTYIEQLLEKLMSQDSPKMVVSIVNNTVFLFRLILLLNTSDHDLLVMFIFYIACGEYGSS